MVAAVRQRFGLGLAVVARMSIVLVAAAALFSTPAQAQDPPGAAAPWPDPGAVRAWLQRETDVVPSAVVFVDQNGLIAISRILPPDATASGRYRARIRAELFDPAAIHARSWAANLYVDCPGRSLRVSQALEFGKSNLQGPSRAMRPSTAWTSPRPGTPFAELLDAICERDHPRPLMERLVRRSGPAETVSWAGAKPPPGEVGLRLLAPEAGLGARPPQTPATSLMEQSGAGPGFQIGAFASERQAHAALEALRLRRQAILQGRTTRLIKTSVDGKTLYRAVVLGFPSRAAASAACASLRAAGETCLVR